MPSLVVDGDGAGRDAPLAKRAKYSHAQTVSRSAKPRIWIPFRTIGLVSPTDVPFTLLQLGKTTFQITTSTGRCLQTYDLFKGLNLVFLTRPQTPAPITATCAWKEQVFAAWGGDTTRSPVGVWAFKRGRRIAELQLPEGFNESIQQLLTFGPWIVGCCSTRIEVWKTDAFEHYTTILPTPSTEGHETPVLSGVICHVPTFLNKILAGKHDGTVEIWNVSSGKLVHCIRPPNKDTGPVSALQPSPALGVVAIACADGTVALHDIKLDKEMLRLNEHAPQSIAITSIAFRLDGFGAGEDGLQDGVMATASTESGDLTFWDLNKRGRVRGILHNAHNPRAAAYGGVFGGVSKIEFLSGQPVIVSSGRDNALKTWIFDEHLMSPVPRVLHSRSGHAAPVSQIEFLPTASDGADDLGKWLLSAGRDRSLWGWSLRRDGQSTELSQGKSQRRAKKLSSLGGPLDVESSVKLEDLKAPEITCIACCLNRDGGMGASTGGGAVWANVAQGKQNQGSADTPVIGWESIVTGHKGDKYARTWFWGRKKAGRWALPTSDGTEVKSVAISPCGTFAVLGSAGGSIDMFNLQSGIRRQRYPAPLTPAQASKLKQQKKGLSNGDTATDEPGGGRHTAAVTGLVVDSLNETVISASLDGTLRFWAFATGRLVSHLALTPQTAITILRHQRANDLLALACDDLAVRIVDFATRRPVRELWGCAAPTADLQLSSDGRWAVAASLDAGLRVWDLPSGHLVDATRMEPPASALALSPTGEFLATAHTGERGVRIWSNRALFTSVPPTRALPVDHGLASPTQPGMPSAAGEIGAGPIEAAFDDSVAAVEEEAPLAVASAVDALSEGLTTLSLLPRARWTTLLHLEALAARNKPIEPPKAPEKAPFFLPSLDKESGRMPQQLPSAGETSNPASTAAERARIARLQRTAGSDRPFGALLQQAASTVWYYEVEAFISHLKSLAPAATDAEVRSLRGSGGLLPEGGANEMVAFVRALTARARQRRDYECLQAWMAVFLAAHGSALVEIEGPEGQEAARVLEAWREVAKAEQERLGELVGYTAGVLQFLRSGR